MSTIHFRAARSAGFAPRPLPSFGAATRLLLIAGVSAALAGCESGNGLLSGNGTAQPETQIANTVAPQTAAPQANLARVSIAPVIGAPDPIGRQLQQEFGSAVATQRASVVAAGDKADYTLRGYIVAAKDRAGTKVSYIWDVTDPSGKRVNRITGEEILAGTQGKDPWAAVTPGVIQTIAQKSASSLGAWLPTAGPQAALAAAPANNVPAGVGANPNSVSTAGVTPSAVARPGQPNATPAAFTPGQDFTAVVPAVVGAPGDGATALTQALQGELGRNGVAAAAGGAAASAYRVEGVVKMGQARDGKQPIQIDWNVKDPQGKRLGTVSQKNEIPEGSLDGSWGKTADAAAAAAAQGILKLLPQRQAAANN